MNSQKCILYGVLIIVALYLLNNVCGLKIPFMEGFEEEVVSPGVVKTNGLPRPMPAGPGTPPPQKQPVRQVRPSDPIVAVGGGINKDVGSCTPQKPLDPSDLLPVKQADEISKFNSENPEGDGILKGVNYLDAGFHVGQNTIGQSLRNANLNIREEPPNPRVAVSPWMNTTIGADLTRRPLTGGSQ